MKNQLTKHKGNTKRRMTGIITFGILLVVLVGALLLILPISSADGTFTHPLDALFTAVSATCVTGLVVVDTATHWSIFGQTVIILMIQIGGLGFMTMAVLMSLIVKKAVSPKARMLVAMSYNLNSYESTLELVKRIIIGTVTLEGLGAVALATQFIPIFGWGDGIFKSIFHSISAFCNAGFDLLGTTSGPFTSLVMFKSNPVVIVTLGLLIILGGIGFLVWSDIINLVRKKKRMSVYSKFVLIITAILLVVGTAVFLAAEYNNPKTLGGLPFGEKLLCAFFQSVTLRTAGFASIDNTALYDVSKFTSLLLMFIGGASGSTAGGVKVGTVGILLCSVWNAAIGKRDTVVFKRRISTENLIRATAVITVQLIMIVLSTAILIMDTPEGTDIVALAFETTSAIGTVGLSLGLTPILAPLSKIVVMCLMYFGRVGILSITFSVMVNLSESRSSITYPDANMLVG